MFVRLVDSIIWNSLALYRNKRPIWNQPIDLNNIFLNVEAVKLFDSQIKDNAN